MILSEQIKAFAADDIDLFTAFQDYWNHWSAENLEVRKHSYNDKLSLDEKCQD